MNNYLRFYLETENIILHSKSIIFLKKIKTLELKYLLIGLVAKFKIMNKVSNKSATKFVINFKIRRVYHLHKLRTNL